MLRFLSILHEDSFPCTYTLGASSCLGLPSVSVRARIGSLIDICAMNNQSSFANLRKGHLVVLLPTPHFRYMDALFFCACASPALPGGQIYGQCVAKLIGYCC